MSSQIEDSDINNFHKFWLVEFRNGNYRKCSTMLKNELASDRTLKSQTLQCIFENNIVVCSYMEMLAVGARPNFESLQSTLRRQLSFLRTVPELRVDANLAILANLLWLHWQDDRGANLAEFEEQISVALPTLSRVLSDGGKDERSGLEEIQSAFQLSLNSFELLDCRQATLVITIRILIALAAQDDFVSQMTLVSRDSVCVPLSLVRPDVDRSSDTPLLLFPLLHGPPCLLAELDVSQSAVSVGLVLTALLARLHRHPPALQSLALNYESAGMRALAIYLRAWLQSESKARLEAKAQLDVLFSLREGREGELGCRARVLQARLVASGGKQQRAINILRQASKSHGSKWVLLKELASHYGNMNQSDAHLETLELQLQSSLTTEPRVLTFEERVLLIVHREAPPTVSDILYQLACLHRKHQRFSLASERLLELLARQEGWEGGLRSLVREASLALLQADKLAEAAVVCDRAATSKLPLTYKGTDWLERLQWDVLALLLSANIHIASNNWDLALAALDRCIAELRTDSKGAELKSRLQARALMLSAEVYVARGDNVNAKHAFHKALLAHRGDREPLLMFVSWLLSLGERQEALSVWHGNERQYDDPPVITTDPVLSFLLSPKMSDTQRVETEKKIKDFIVRKT